MIRHAVTVWNETGRVQGRTDVPLGERGRRMAAGWRLPARFEAYRAYSSPLGRAVETAALLGLPTPVLDRRLMEMHWGEWEGRTRAEISAAGACGVARNEARGPDFRPPGGESPREVQARIVDWARSVAESGSGVVVVTHKGVIKATMGLACAWNLVGKSPVRLDWTRAHRFRFDPYPGMLASMRCSPPSHDARDSIRHAGTFTFVEPNIRLERDG